MLRINGIDAVRAELNGVEVWRAGPEAEISASLALVSGSTVKITTTVTGDPPVSYKFYYTTNGTTWVNWKNSTSIGPHEYTTSYSTTIRMRVDAVQFDGSVISATTNSVTIGAAPVTTARTIWIGTASSFASYYTKSDGSIGRRTVNSDNSPISHCYYGYVSTVWRTQFSQVRFSIPARIRNCVAVHSVELRWYNEHTYVGSGGLVSMVGHHNTSLGNTYGGSTQPLRHPTTLAQMKFSAPKPGWINGDWFSVGTLTSAGRPSIKEEIRVNNLQGFGLVAAASGTTGYGYAETTPELRIDYTYNL